ncbi:hypothetical protein [Microbacterium caowuchunii]|uniref:TQXA domain-containing protein n=1 Tax=Microbacterium caowuchunii TaxID=2614638 RepID=A0A5N0T9K4_9MICO|nr:hypothetical protein [Microbacterium caowuchunii]KAA9131174.1 hypothetical protein F6B40_12820 [Microbacterium caowuchunii]
MKRVLPALLIIAALVVAGLVATRPAQAASPGSGFGEWGPSTRFGWHGSMIVDGIHTYCIFPGLPLPTGESQDRGISADAAGLDPQRLTAINMLISTYGQTTDPVQAAGVGWAVKAIADRETALHTFGYPGDSLAGAVDWVFRHIAPAHSLAVQHLVETYYAEGMAMPVGAQTASGSLQFTTDASDPLLGTVTVIADQPDARGTLALEHAVFTDTGEATLEDARVGQAYALTATPGTGREPVTVRGSGTFQGGFRPAVHHFTTAGGQDTAGPAGRTEFPVAGEDATPRETTFAPVVTTQVAHRYIPSGRYVDDVTFLSARGAWPRTAEQGYLPVRATATLYRTDREPLLTPEVPADAEVVATLEATTDGAVGPTAPYRVESDEPLPGPGFYTAVWTIDADGQHAETIAALEEGYRWQEQFGEQTQITMLTAVSSQAEPVVAVGAPLTDDLIVSGVLPADGLHLTASVHRVPDGVAEADACTPENLLWAGPEQPVHITAPGRTRIEGPAAPDFGTYVWRERAVDAQGLLVHEGACGVEAETTRAPLPTVETRALAAVGWGGEATDTAIVTGPIPATGSTTLTFQLHRGTEGVAPADACTPDSLVADTSATPITVTAAGEFLSPGMRLHHPGAHYWIERLWYTPEGGEPRLLAEGACGLENETTMVERPGLTTRAVERAALDAPFHDSAVITGLGEGVDAEVVFTVFHTEADERPICTPANLETTTTAVPVTGAGEYRSPEVRSSTPGAKHWIAELRARVSPDAEPVVLHTGTCGEDGETTYVDVLAETGAATPPAPMRVVGGLGAVLVAAGLLVAAGARRRPAPATSAATPETH